LAEAGAIAKLRASPKKKDFSGSPLASSLLGIAEQVVRGRAAAAQGNWTEAARDLEKAAVFQDEVQARDPPFWDFPVREALGVALFRAGKPQQAAETLRHALLEAPNSGYALYALKEVSAALGDATAVAEYGKLFDKAWAGTNPPVLDRL